MSIWNFEAAAGAGQKKKGKKQDGPMLDPMLQSWGLGSLAGGGGQDGGEKVGKKKKAAVAMAASNDLSASLSSTISALSSSSGSSFVMPTIQVSTSSSKQVRTQTTIFLDFQMHLKKPDAFASPRVARCSLSFYKDSSPFFCPSPCVA